MIKRASPVLGAAFSGGTSWRRMLVWKGRRDEASRACLRGLMGLSLPSGGSCALPLPLSAFVGLGGMVGDGRGGRRGRRADEVPLSVQRARLDSRLARARSR